MKYLWLRRFIVCTLFFKKPPRPKSIYNGQKSEKPFLTTTQVVFEIDPMIMVGRRDNLDRNFFAALSFCFFFPCPIRWQVASAIPFVLRRRLRRVHLRAGKKGAWKYESLHDVKSWSIVTLTSPVSRYSNTTSGEIVSPVHSLSMQRRNSRNDASGSFLVPFSDIPFYWDVGSKKLLAHLNLATTETEAR